MSSSVSSRKFPVQGPIPNPLPKSHLGKRLFLQAALPKMPKELIKLIGSYANEILGGLYAEDAWKKWKGVEILDTIPRPPRDPLGNRILLYMPQRIRIWGEDLTLTSHVLRIISGGFTAFSPIVKKQLENETVTGWVFLDKDVIPASRGKVYADQEQIAQDRGCTMMHPMEVITLIRMVFAFTGEQLFQGNYTVCSKKIVGGYPIVVGNFYDSEGFEVSFDYDRRYARTAGVACAQRVNS